MSKAIEVLSNQIDADKEVLNLMPRKTKKNITTFKEKSAELKLEYESLLNNINAEIKRRIIRLNSVEINPKIDELANEINEMKKIQIFNVFATPFEKMNLDKTLFILRRFYKNNLELVNESISNTIEAFNEAGITLELKDFNYSIYVNEYMNVFIEESKKGEINSQRVKETFEEIYWKCPDIILHIELNFRSLYLKNEKTITSYFESEEKQILKKLRLSKTEAIDKLKALEEKLKGIKNRDSYLILQKFKEGKLSPKDYTEYNFSKNFKKLTNYLPNELEDEKLEEYNQNIEKLSNSLREYKNYLQYKFILDEIIEIFKDDKKYSKLLNDTLKNIQKLERKLIKANKNIEKYSKHVGLLSKFFKGNQKKLEKVNVNSNEIIIQLKTLYKSYEEYKIKNIIKENITNSSTIYDALLVASAFYGFLVNIIIKQFEDIDQESINNIITEFMEFINDTNVNVINNIAITEDKDLAIVIKDKYNLCDINIEKGDFAEDSIDNMLYTVENICEYNYILSSKLSVEDIKFIVDAEKNLELN